MKAVFDTVLELSIQASWIILAVIAARFLLKSAPKWLRCSLWALVALRLLCPVTMESPFSLVPEIESTRTVISQVTQYTPEETDVSGIAYGEMISSEGDVLVRKEMQKARGEILSSDGELLASKPLKASAAPADHSDIFLILWILGVLLMVGYAAFSYLRLKKKVGPSINLGNGVFLCDYVESPFILGIFKPAIYLPSELDPASAQYVLAHEKAHLRRKDHWWKPLGYCLLCIHWFNPLVWIAYILLCRDIELACDEKVIRDLGPVDKKAYSEALLRCTVSRKLLLACPLAFGEVGVKQRVKSVLSYKKPGFWIMLASVLLVCILSVGFLTDPERDTLSDLCPVERENVTCIDLWNDRGHCCMGNADYLEKTWKMLDSVEYEPEMQTDTYDPYGIYPSFWFFVGEEPARLYLNEDYSQLIPGELGPDTESYQYYPIQDPEAVKELFEEHIAIVYNREVTAEAFAQVGQPYEWIQGMNPDALSWVRLGYSYSSSGSTGGYLSKVAFEELSELLKNIPADALSNRETIGENGLDHIKVVYSDYPNLAVTFQDMANDLGVVVRYREDDNATPYLEFLMIDGAYTVSGDNHAYIRPVEKWEIDSPELLAWFRKMEPYPPYANMVSGHWMEAENDWLEISNGESTISLRPFTGWTYEVVEPSADSESFGIRFRHPEESEGWIYVSFWPEGYENTEVNRYFSQGGSGYTSLPLTSLYPNGMEYQEGSWTVQVDYYENGDFAVIKEGAENWSAVYADEIDVQLNYIRLKAGDRVSKDAPEMVVDLEYTQCEDPKYAFKQFDLETADRAYMSLSGKSDAVPCGWMYDDSPKGENVLFTFWPEYMTEGMVCVEYHEGFFQPPEGMTVEEDSLLIESYGGAHPAKRGTLAGDDHWTYLWIDRKNGSYVFRFENTEHWDQRRIEECIWALHTFQFRG